MREVVHILFGAAFTVGVSVALGLTLMRRLGLVWHRMEAALLAFIAGSACLSFLTALLCLVHQARRGVFLWGGLAAIGWAIWAERRERQGLGAGGRGSGVGGLGPELGGRGPGAGSRPIRPGSPSTPRRKRLPAVPFGWLLLFSLVFMAFFLCYFFNAMAPETSPDGSGYHLGNVARMWRHHGFDWDYRSMYSYLSQGMEMLFLVAFAFGGHSAAAMVHFTFLNALALLIVAYGRRFGFPRAGVFGAILVYACPVIGMDGTAAYNDLAVATLTFAVFYLLQVWDEVRSSNILLLIGLLCGSAFGVKYTAFLVFPVAMAFAGWHGARLRGLILLAVPASLMVAPWIVRNWIWVGNPMAPFLNAGFPNPYYHAGMEKIYVDSLSHYMGIQHAWEIPLQLTMRGSLVEGLAGPAFLLAPLALLALRSPQLGSSQLGSSQLGSPQGSQRQAGRLLAAAVVFAVPAYFNTGARFLIPALPFVALALGLGLSQSRGVLLAVALFHAVVSWPAVLSTYCDHWAWRVASIPVKAALRREPEWPYILQRLGDLALKGPIEQAVPAGEKIFSFAGRPDAYIDRDIVVQYESTLGNLVQDILQAPAAHPPKHLQAFQFLPVTARGVRVVNLAAAANFWTVAEMRIRSQGRELGRSPGWRVSAWPNGWEAPLAFDNSYATRWSTWQAMSPGARLQAEWSQAETVDSVWLECDPAWEAKVQVEVLTERGRWVAITDTAERSTVDLPTGIRRAASRDVKGLGIRFLWINGSDFCAEDMKNYSKFWGITLVGEANGTRFYRID
jgi:hypothetical protein